MTAAAPRPRATPRYRGRIDRIEAGVIEGWALVDDGQTPAELEVIVDGELLGVAVADRPRPDLTEQGIGTGHHGFRFQVPDGVSLEDRSTLPVMMFRNTGVPLRAPAFGKGPRQDPMMVKLDSLLAAVLTLGQILRQQKQSTGQDLHHHKEDLHEIQVTVQRLESIVCIGLAQSLRDHVSVQTTRMVRASLARQFRTLRIMGLLAITLMIGIGLGLVMVLAQ